jgi:hypothetical protein
MASRPDLRVGDADREAAAALLREHYAQGRLTMEEFRERLDAAFAATTESQLNALTSDLPLGPVPGALPGPASGGGQRSQRPGGSRRSRAGVIPATAMMFAVWLIVLALLLPTARFGAGRFLLILALAAVVRSLLRRLFGARHWPGRGWGWWCGPRGR